MNKNTILDYIYITVGAFLLAVAYAFLFDKVELIAGGCTSICIMVKYFTNIPLWVTNLAINLPLLIIAIMLDGKKVGIRTIYGTLALSMFLAIENIDLNFFSEVINDNDLFLIALYGGIISGVGNGLVFKGLGTTGGTDIVAIIIKHFKPYATLGTLLTIIESTIVVLGAYFFGVQKGLYAILAIYVCYKISDVVALGARFGKVVYIISNKYDEITNEILSKLSRGVTALEGTGMYSKDNKKVLMCACNKKEVPVIKKIVQKIDEDSFIISCTANEVVGRGFVNINQEEL